MKRCLSVIVACAVVGCGDNKSTTPIQVATVQVTATTSTLHSLTETTALRAVARDAYGTEIPGTIFTWTTSDAAIASIAADPASTAYVATATGNGDATITATTDGISGTATLHVSQTVASLVVTPPSTTLLSITDTVRLAATARDALGQTIQNAPAPQWTGSSSTIADVSATGLVTALANGDVTVSATIGTVSGSATVTVAQTPVRIGFINPPVSTRAGGTMAPITVGFQDALGHAVKSATNTGSISIGTNPAGGTLGGSTTATAVSGVATFSGLSIDQLGTGYTLSVSMQPDPAAFGTSLTATSAAFDIVDFDAQLDSISLASSVIQLGGDRTVSYTVFARNATGHDLTTMFIQTYMEQGTTVAASGGTSLFGCGSGTSVLSPGVCAMQSGSNIVGRGGFVAGPAVLRVELRDSNNLYTTIRKNVTLQ